MRLTEAYADAAAVFSEALTQHPTAILSVEHGHPRFSIAEALSRCMEAKLNLQRHKAEHGCD